MEKTSVCFILRDSEVILSKRCVAKFRLRRKTVNIEQNFAEIVLRELQILQTIARICATSILVFRRIMKMSKRSTTAAIEYKNRSESPEHDQLVNYIL